LTSNSVPRGCSVSFEAAYKGQMELYLRWLDNFARYSDTEESPIGLILCSAKDEEQIELLQLTQGQIRVAEHWTALPALGAIETQALQGGPAREQLAPKPATPGAATGK
jgi:hypothetical protein